MTQDGESRYCTTVKILGPSAMVQCNVDETDPNKPYIWLETDSPIEIDGSVV